MAKKHNKAHIPASPVAVDNQVPLSINQLDDVYSIVHEMIENLDEAAISELSGGQNLSIDQIIDT